MVVLCQACKRVNKNSLGHVVYLPRYEKVNIKKVLALRDRDTSVAQIARLQGVTPRRIQQILHKYTQN